MLTSDFCLRVRLLNKKIVMIIITDCSKDIKIPAGLGDNAGVVYEKAGVNSVNGEQGDVTLKTVNGEALTGEGNIEIKAGVTSVNGQTGDVTVDVPTVPTKVSELQNDADYQNGEQVKTAITDALTGVSAGIEWMIVNDENASAIDEEVSTHWDNGNYTGKKMFKCIKNGKTLFATNVQYIENHSVTLVFLNQDNYDVKNSPLNPISAIIWHGSAKIQWDNGEFPKASVVTTHLFHSVDVRQESDKDEHNIEVFKLFDKAVQEGGDFQNFYIASGNRDEVMTPYMSIISVEAHENDGYGADKYYSVIAFKQNGGNIEMAGFAITSLGGAFVETFPKMIEDRVCNCELYFDNHIDEGSNFENPQVALYGCQRDWCFQAGNMNRGLTYVIIFNQGYGDSVKGAQVPLNVWSDGTNAFFSFDINDKRYLYKRTDNENFNFQYVKTLEIETGGGSGKKVVLNDLTQDEYKAIREKVYAEMKASGHTEDTYFYKKDDTQSIEITSIYYEEENNAVAKIVFDSFTANLDRWKFQIDSNNEFSVLANGERANIKDIEWYPYSIATISFQQKMYGDDRDKSALAFIEDTRNNMYDDTMYGIPFIIYFRYGFGDFSLFSTGGIVYMQDDDKYFEFTFKNYNYRYHLNSYNQIISIEKEYIAFNDTTLCNVQGGFSLSEADTNIFLYTYGVGAKKDDWDVYINGDTRTVQTLTVIPTDGTPRSKVPVTFDCAKDSNKAAFYFELHGYRYTYTQVDGNSWKFTSKEKIVTPADIANKVTSTSISNIVVLTQTEYDALSSKDANTMYCIKG